MYSKISQEQEIILKKLLKQKNAISFTRIVLLAASVYFLYLMLYRKQEVFGWMALVFIVLFILVVTVYLKLQSKVAYHKTLKQINTNELSFLSGTHQFNDGLAYQNPQHAFSYDLDLFGPHSIFQFINRTGTFLGEEALAESLQQIPTADYILQKQEAIKELAPNLTFRQHFQALSHLADTAKEDDLAIKKWSESSIQNPPKGNQILAIAFPVLLFLSILGWIFNLHVVFPKLVFLFFTLNLIAMGSFSRFIMKEIGKSDKISNTLMQYSKMLQAFESQSFQSKHLQLLQNQLKFKQNTAFEIVTQLANHFEKLNTIANLFVFIAFNGLFQYHFWVYKKLQNWKSNHQKQLWEYMKILGEVEALNSLANFAYNNSDYQYPNISSDQITFENLGHPLIPKEKRVRNSIDFHNKSFVILTGSNMSGKSTFLRTIGINLVLSYCGAPIDAQQASVYPLPLWVSMRLTDSLSDSESFFFAEVKRLKQIVTKAEKQPIFVLLDEILKGTNSNDKQSGTIGVIEKLHQMNVLGVIATHDLEVCETTNKYPETMENKCFEVEIINNELHFDYLLKDGICQNKNATFIMKKMEII
ncbi:DNA mismatch repair protein MutS [Flavobacterium sp. CBA20B-1]|uniref:MutS-related protein n=1 Tax=unclassified Flavobacterium TaxID=196869 RepID=UPI00222571C2|nr:MULTISPECIES: DNA mismatch repair protein MutS [unclassified Flavobacterium]WCM42161.1 DNA mismatch repair protein MutS [Flavobacterium sp. CBA20B-1]